MNNLYERDPVPNELQRSSEEPLGFIYPTYRAAPTEAHRLKPSLNGSHQEIAYFSSSVGGSVSTLSFEDTTINNRLSPPTRRGGGIRDRVRGFSRSSRRNLLRSLACINRSAFRAFKGRIIFVTLTYPGEYPEDPGLCKRHLKALRKRLQREYEPVAAFWRMGIQTRGAWHFHLLLFVGPSFGPIGELRRFISSSWLLPSERSSGSTWISEGAALLLGQNPRERRAIRDRVRGLYRKRSDIMHQGGGEEVTRDDVVWARKLVHNIIRRIINSRDNFVNQDGTYDIATWLEDRKLAGGP